MDTEVYDIGISYFAIRTVSYEDGSVLGRTGSVTIEPVDRVLNSWFAIRTVR
jgi:hypothetical protein